MWTHKDSHMLTAVSGVSTKAEAEGVEAVGDGLLDRFIKDRLGEFSPNRGLLDPVEKAAFSTQAQSVIGLMPDTVKEAVYHLEHDEPVPDRKADEVRTVFKEYVQDFASFREGLQELQVALVYGNTKPVPLAEARLLYFEAFFPASVNALIGSLNDGNPLSNSEIETVKETFNLSFIEPMEALMREFESMLDGQDDTFLGLSQEMRDLLQVIGEDQIMEQMDNGNFSSVTPYWLKRRMTSALDVMNRTSPDYNPHWNAKRIRDVFDAIKILRQQDQSGPIKDA